MWRPFRHHISVRLEKMRNMKTILRVMLGIKTEAHDPRHERKHEY
jgi:hypothetical protein